MQRQFDFEVVPFSYESGGVSNAESWSEVSGSYYPESESETIFSFTGFPKSVLDAVRRGLESVAIQLAVAAGFRDENRLADLIFFARHPERHGRLLKTSEAKLVKEWLRDIRDRLVRPALFKAFFAEYDLRTSPDAKVGVPANPKMSSTEKADRVNDVKTMATELLRRRDKRADEALKGKVPASTAVAGSLRDIARRLSSVQLDLFREFFPDKKGGIRFDVFQQAFEQFANGELRNPSRNPKNSAGRITTAVGEPDSGFYFLFAEFAFVCVEAGIDQTDWTHALRSFVKTQEIFMHIYRPAPHSAPPAIGASLPKPPARRTLDDFSFENFDATGQSLQARQKALRARYDSMSVNALKSAAAKNLVRALCMP